MIAAKVALLQVLEDGPGYGKELAERVSKVTGEAIHLYDGSIYPALQQLLAQEQIEECGTQGRSKVYRITLKGIRQAKLDREAAIKLFDRDKSAQKSD